MDVLLSILLGLGLSAACGFRVFVPFLVVGVAASAGRIELPGSFEFLSSPFALTILGLATALEIGAYFVPWLDNTLDTLATPASAVAGTIVTLAFVQDLDPMLGWSLAVIGGGGLATATQATTSVVRLASTGLTGGLANPLIAGLELVAAAAMSLASLILPLLALPLLLASLVAVTVVTRRRRGGVPLPAR